MAEYNLGTAKGRIEIDAKGAVGVYSGVGKSHDTFMGKLQGAAPQLKKTGKMLMGIGAAAAVGIGLAVKASADFEKSLSSFKAVTSATEEEMDKVRETALRIGRDTAFGAGEAAEAMVNLGKAGIDTADIINGAADAVVALAAAGDIELASAASIMSAAMNIFNISGKDAIVVADTLAGAANNADTDVQGLGEALKNVGPSASLLGLSIEDTASAIALMAESGIKGGQAGTTLNRMLLNMTKQTPKAEKVMKDLGLMTEEGANAFFDAEGNMKSMGEVAGLLQGAMKGLTKEQQATALEAIFGSRALAAASAMADAGTEGFNSLKDSISEVSAADVAEEKLNNLAGAMTILKGTIETALIGVGTPLQSMLKGIVETITGLINSFARMSPTFQKFVAIGGVVVAALGLVGGAFLILLAMLPAIVAGFGAFFTVVVPVVAPILAIGAAIAALAAGFIWAYKNIEPFRQVVNKVASVIKDKVLSAFRAISSFVQGAFASAMEWLKKTWEDLQPQIQTLRESLQGMADRFRQLVQVVSPFVEMIGTFLAAAFNKLWSIAQPIIGFLVTLIGDTLRMAIQGIVQVFQGVVSVISGILDVFIGLFTGNWSQMWEGIKGIFVGVWNIIVGLVKTYLAVGVFKIVGGALKAITGLFTKGWAAIRGLFTSAGNGIVSTVRGAMDTIRLRIWQVMDAIRKVFTTVLNAIGKFISSIFSGIRSTVTQGMSFIRSSISSAMNTIRAIITNIWSAIRSFISGAINGARTTVVNGFNAIRTGVSNALSRLLALVRALPGNILRALGNTGKMLWNAGKNIISGLIGGITAMGDRVKGAVTGVLKKARNLLPFSPAKEGPFSGKGWTLYSGRSLVEGLAKGIDNARLAAVRAARSMAESVSGAMTVAEPAMISMDHTFAPSGPPPTPPAPPGLGSLRSELAALADRPIDLDLDLGEGIHQRYRIERTKESNGRTVRNGAR